MARVTFLIARKLLTAEHERLLRDHYDDGRNRECDGCARAADIRAEVAALSVETCAYCGADLYGMVRAHHHTENGEDVTRPVPTL